MNNRQLWHSCDVIRGNSEPVMSLVSVVIIYSDNDFGSYYRKKVTDRHTHTTGSKVLFAHVRGE